MDVGARPGLWEQGSRSHGTLVMILVCAAYAISIATVYADTTYETGITVTTTDTGTFSLSFSGSSEFQFFDSQGSPSVGVSAVQGATAFATVEIQWLDDRVESNRLPYSISIQSTDLTSAVALPDGTGSHSLPAAQLSIIQIGDTVLAQPLSLDHAREVFVSGATPTAGEHALRLILRLDVPPSSFPTTYTAELGLLVTHGENDL